MELMKAIKTRRSIRRYLDKPVENEKLLRVLDAGRLAPSAKNRQNWKFIIVQNPESKKYLSEVASNQSFIAQAPIVIVCCAYPVDYMLKCGIPDYPINISIAMDHMTLKAVEEELGTCWIGSFDPKKVCDLLEIPDTVEVVELLTLGYPAEHPAEKPRVNLEDIVMQEKWQDA